MNLERAREIAHGAFMGRLDKAQMPYVGHLARVAAYCQGDAEIVAWLHDLLEDCPEWDADRLRAEGFAPQVVNAVLAITKVPGENYAGYLERVKADPLARAVKLWDLHDNMDLRRLPDPGPADFERFAKYNKARRFLAA